MWRAEDNEGKERVLVHGYCLLLLGENNNNDLNIPKNVSSPFDRLDHIKVISSSLLCS